MKKTIFILLFFLPMTIFGQGWFWTHTPILPTVLTDKWDYVGISTVYGFGTVLKDGGSRVSARGFVYSLYAHPTLTSVDVSIKTDGSGLGEFVTFIDALSSNTKYYIRAYATNKIGTSYGYEYNFTTSTVSINAPTVSTTAISSIDLNTASTGGNVTSDGGATVTSRGVCYNTTGAPTIDGSKTTNGSGTGSFTSSLSGLTQGITYYVRAYATNDIGTGYGSEVTFTTLSQIPSVTTTTVSEVNITYARVGWNITSSGGSALFSSGVVLNKTGSPALDNYTEIVSDLNPAVGEKTEYISELESNTLYYYRSFAENLNGVSYGSTLSFTTGGETVTLPVVTLSTIYESYVTSGYFKLLTVFYGGEVVSSGGATVYERGYVYSSSDAHSNPVIGETGVTQEVDGSGLGVFESSKYSFTPGKIYYFRAYAKNSKGTAYSTTTSYLICKLPSSYTSVLYLAASITIDNVYNEFYDSVYDAVQACSDIKTPAGRAVNMNSFAILNYWGGINNNDAVYVLYSGVSGNECHMLVAGYYYFYKNGQRKIIQIDSDGICTSILTCD